MPIFNGVIALTTDLLDREAKALLTIYIGQNIRPEGILQTDVKDKEAAKWLISKGLIRENNRYLLEYLTTDKGAEIGKLLIENRIKDNQEKLRIKLQEIPPKVLSFFIRRFIVKSLDFPKEPVFYDDSWEHQLLRNARLVILWKEFFSALISFEFCVEVYSYVFTRGGETRGRHFVISQEVQQMFEGWNSSSDFTSDQEDTLKLYPVIKTAIMLADLDDVELVRTRLYEVLNAQNLTEEKLAGIVNHMNELHIASVYRGLLSNDKPFDIKDGVRANIYLDKNLVEPAIQILLGQKGSLPNYNSKLQFPSLDYVKAKGGYLDLDELAEFYRMNIDMEIKLREFIKKKLGSGWEKRIKNDLPEVMDRLSEKREKDVKYGIAPDADILNYAELSDYIDIIEKYDRIFLEGYSDSAQVTPKLKDWYVYGRNPVMHGRAIDEQKYYTTKSIIDFLKQWMYKMT